jgi:dUTP pyrophosphatase
MEHVKTKTTFYPSSEGLDGPRYHTQGSSGFDLRADIFESVELAPLQRHLFPTGLSINFKDGFDLQIRPKSGLALNNGITVLNSPGTIDSDYEGEIKILLINLGQEPFVVERGMRIAQGVFSRLLRVDESVTKGVKYTSGFRGIRGFGSTGTC